MFLALLLVLVQGPATYQDGYDTRDKENAHRFARMSAGRLIREIDILSIKTETGERAAEQVVQQALAARQLALLQDHDSKSWWQQTANYNRRAIERWRQIQLSPNTFNRFAKERIVTLKDRLEEAEAKAK